MTCEGRGESSEACGDGDGDDGARGVLQCHLVFKKYQIRKSIRIINLDIGQCGIF